MKESLDHQIAEWLQNGVITESVSEYSSPLVQVKKKDSDVRWCVDFRQVNNRIIADSFPIPPIEELVQKAAGKKIYSALDCFAAYNHVRVHLDSRKYTAFSTPDCHYEYLPMPFGLKTAVSVYSRFVAMAMAGVAPDKIGIYLDDMLVFTDDPYEHLKVLEEVFQKHREVGLMLKPSKTFLFQMEVEYLGHQLSWKGIAMVPSYQQKITSWPSPTTKQELIFVLTIDFLALALGVTLSQKQNGREQLIAAAGRRTTPGEKNYASWKGEYAALVYGIRKYEHILSYKKFYVKTDRMTLCHHPNIFLWFLNTCDHYIQSTWSLFLLLVDL